MPVKNITYKGAIKELGISIIDTISNLFTMLKSRRMIIFVVTTALAWKYGMPLVKDTNDIVKVLGFIAGVGLGTGFSVAWERRANGNNKK